MRTRTALLAAAVALLGACSRTESGDVVVKRPVEVKTTDDTIKMPQMTTKTDTINAPVVGTKTDTIIVKKPVIGTKKTEVKVPVVKRP
ncbi:MAG: hypothetical protein ACREBE_08560 [bacterium]